ncbi:glycosyltransferase [Vibrio atypicus]|uniref:glycosyltransferase n=1 Tax=Vibrio atypicus TaxID=558271 RepID=UPI003734F4EF
MPLVTIGLPVYNAEKYLDKAILSVLSQTYQNWELIIVDDGSSDRSLDIAQSYRDPRIIIHSDGHNKKLPARLNEIVQLAKGQFVARMDADDIIAPDRIEKQVSYLLNNDETDLVSTGLCSMNDNEQVLGVRIYQNKPLSVDDVLLGHSGIVHAAVLARKSWFERHPYSTDYPLAEDYELWARAAVDCDLKYHLIEEPLYYYREDSSISLSKLMVAYTSQASVIKNLGYRGERMLPLHYYFYIKKCVAKAMHTLRLEKFLLTIRRMNGVAPDMKTKIENNIKQVIANP